MKKKELSNLTQVEKEKYKQRREQGFSHRRALINAKQAHNRGKNKKRGINDYIDL